MIHQSGYLRHWHRHLTLLRLWPVIHGCSRWTQLGSTDRTWVCARALYFSRSSQTERQGVWDPSRADCFPTSC
eukprot:2491978-Rhodomonas_salina.1